MDEKLGLQSTYKVSGIITGIFVFIILTVFPLVFTDFYFNILQTKLYFYCASVITLFVVMLLYICCQALIKGKEWERIKLRLSKWSMPEYFMIAFIVISIISTLQSDYIYESFWGNEGRYTGLFMWLLYGASFFLVVKFFEVKSWYFDAFLAVGLLVCLFGITDYFQMDLLRFKENINPQQKNMFVSTIGNVNTYTSYVALVMGSAAVLYCTAQKKISLIWYYLCLVVSFFAIIMGLSDNSYLALGALFAFLPLYLFRTRTGIRRYAFMLATFSGVIWCVDFINKLMPDKVLEMSGLLRAVSGYNKLELIVIILFLLSGIIYIVDYIHKDSMEEVGKWVLYSWLGLILIGVLGVAAILFDANIAGHAGRYGSFSNYLIFNDDWGTHRGYNWRIAIEQYKEFTPLHKIFGYGPDTYGILSVLGQYYEEMKNRYHEIFDSVHNEYLHFFITVGPFGMLAYIGLLVSSITRIIRKALNNKYAMAAAFAVICYSVQAIVNISIPIATPIMLTLMMMGLAACRTGEEV